MQVDAPCVYNQLSLRSAGLRLVHNAQLTIHIVGIPNEQKSERGDEGYTHITKLDALLADFAPLRQRERSSKKV